MKKIAVFYYHHFAQFEIVQALLLLKNKCELTCFGLEEKNYQSEEGQWYYNTQSLKDIDPTSLDLLIIPGGDSRPLYDHQALKGFIEKLINTGGKVAGICGGSELLAAFSLLDGRACTGNTSGVFESDPVFAYYAKTHLCNDKQVVVDGPFITGQGQAYSEFALEIANQMGFIKDELERIETLKWLKNIRD